MNRRSTYRRPPRSLIYREHVAAALGAVTGALAMTLAAAAMLLEVTR